jgi:uncharacterized protein (UPF0332 family)
MKFRSLSKGRIKAVRDHKGVIKVLNELLKEALKSEKDIIQLVYSQKIMKTTAKEFENFRKEPSRRLKLDYRYHLPPSSCTNRCG